MNDETGRARVDDERAAAILDRAARLDAGLAREVDLAQLREAALEAGISPGSFERALAEVSADEARKAAAHPLPAPKDPPAYEPRLPTLVRRLVLAAGGLLLGSVPYMLDAMGIDSEAGVIFSFALALQILLFLVFRHRKDRSVVDFEIDLTTLWTGMTLSLMIAESGQADDIAAIMSMIWLVSAVVGGFLVWVRGWWERDPPELPERT